MPNWRSWAWKVALLAAVGSLVTLVLVLASRSSDRIGARDDSPAATASTLQSPYPSDTTPVPTDVQPPPGDSPIEHRPPPIVLSPSGDESSGVLPPPDIPETSPPPTTSDELADHLAACHQQLESRRAGRVAYPRSLAVPVDQSATYEASLDIRPGAQQRPAPDTDINVEDVEVPCGVGA